MECGPIDTRRESSGIKAARHHGQANSRMTVADRSQPAGACKFRSDLGLVASKHACTEVRTHTLLVRAGRRQALGQFQVEIRDVASHCIASSGTRSAGLRQGGQATGCHSVEAQSTTASMTAITGAVSPSVRTKATESNRARAALSASAAEVAPLDSASWYAPPSGS